MTYDFKNKKLLILGANPETTPLVEYANGMGIKTIVTSNIPNDHAKRYAWKSYDINGLDVPSVVELARKERVDGVLVGVADVLVSAYCKVCDELELPCYATEEIVNVFTNKDIFKATCERYGIHGIPEYYLDEKMNQEDIDKIEYPVMIKPVDGRSGVGMSVCYNEKDLHNAIVKALKHSRKKRFIVEKYMNCEDTGMYYTFSDGKISVSCLHDRNTCSEQKGVSKVCQGCTYPSVHASEYFERMHDNICHMFKDIGIKNGVLLISAFFEKGEFYVYDMGFRLQGEAPHLLMKAINGLDQREMLIKFALTGSMDCNNLELDDPYFKGKSAATLWILLKEGTIDKIEGLDEVIKDKSVVNKVQRLDIGDTVLDRWIGTELQVMTRLYIVCDTKEELAKKIEIFEKKIKVYDKDGKNMVLKGYDARASLRL